MVYYSIRIRSSYLRRPWCDFSPFQIQMTLNVLAREFNIFICHNIPTTWYIPDICVYPLYLLNETPFPKWQKLPTSCSITMGQLTRASLGALLCDRLHITCSHISNGHRMNTSTRGVSGAEWQISWMRSPGNHYEIF